MAPAPARACPQLPAPDGGEEWVDGPLEEDGDRMMGTAMALAVMELRG